jgi:hypothetical protein
MTIASLKVPLKRGALVVAANWPVVVVQFIAEATYKLLIGVPIVGGTFLVALVLGADVEALWSGGWTDRVAALIEALRAHPGALGGFLGAMAVAVVGGACLMFLIKGGSVAVMVFAEAAAPIERPASRLARWRRRWRADVDVFLRGCRELFPRYLRLGLMLLTVYGVLGAVYLVVVAAGYLLISGTWLAALWTLVAGAISVLLAAVIALVNVAYLLMQMIIAASDCSVREAARTLRAFAAASRGPVAGVFLAILALGVLATVAAILTAAALGVISLVPFIGLIALPLQAIAWLVRGLVFQYLGFSALAAYASLYRGWAEASGAVAEIERPA